MASRRQPMELEATAPNCSSAGAAAWNRPEDRWTLESLDTWTIPTSGNREIFLLPSADNQRGYITGRRVKKREKLKNRNGHPSIISLPCSFKLRSAQKNVCPSVCWIKKGQRGQQRALRVSELQLLWCLSTMKLDHKMIQNTQTLFFKVIFTPSSSSWNPHKCFKRRRGGDRQTVYFLHFQTDLVQTVMTPKLEQYYK